MRLFTDPNLVGLLIQALGAVLIATLCSVLQRTVRRDPLKYWTIGWATLSIALATLWVSFQVSAGSPVGHTIYMLGEYIFGYLVFAGCRQYATGQHLRLREAWLLVPAALLAIGLPLFGSADFDVFFTFHTLIYGYLFLASYRVLRRARVNDRSLAGLRVMKIALALLTIGYFHYAPLFAMSSYGLLPATVPYLVYTPLYDLMFLFMLMFGMIMAVTGGVQHELEQANVELEQAHDRLESTARLDHLTSALNRHALYSLIDSPGAERRAVWSGSAAIADIDNLKAINDQYGHAAGDAAIRAVASAIRSCIRAADLLFRWGGDEFLVLLMGVPEVDARARLATINDSLRALRIANVPAPITVTVTIGFAPFEGASSLDQVIALADEAMFKRKKR